MDDDKVLWLIAGLLLGLLLMWVISQKRKTVTTLTRDSEGRIIEILETML